MVVGSLESVAEECCDRRGGVSCAAPTTALIQLRERNRGQARLLLSARRRIRVQSDLASQLHKEKDANLRTINAQLLLFEANLRRRQDELSAILREKELTIRNQHRLILALASAYSQVTGHSEIVRVLANTSKEEPEVDLPKILKELLSNLTSQEPFSRERQSAAENANSVNNKELKQEQNVDQSKEHNEEIKLKQNENSKEQKDTQCNQETAENLKNLLEMTTDTSDKKSDGESVNDTDSAIMLEDTCSDSLVILPIMRDGVKVIRSVSDALECAARPLQIAPPLDSTNTTPVNSPPCTPPTVPATDGHISKSSSRGSLSTTPSSYSSSEDSDVSPTATLQSTPRSDQNNATVKEDSKIINRHQLVRAYSDGPLNVTSSGQEICIADISELLCHSSDLEYYESRSNSKLEKSMSVDLDSLISSDCPSLSSQYDSDSTLSESANEADCVEEADQIVDCYEKCSHESNECQNSEETFDCYPDRRLTFGPCEDIGDIEVTRKYRRKPDDRIQVTYNRVMSNHRSVTKVKDVKYKRINKAKSRSLEELRGKLRIHEGKPLISVSIGHSYA